MTINERQVNGISIFDLDGEIRYNHAPLLNKNITDKINKGQSTIIINFKKVTYIDSSGIGALINVLKKIKDIKGHFALINLSTQVNKVFELTRLTKLFDIHISEGEAIASFEKIRK